VKSQKQFTLISNVPRNGFLNGSNDIRRDKTTGINLSRAPLKSPNEISTEEKQRIISIRNKLEFEPFAQFGVSAIKWELRKLGLDFPSDRTINRVLKREGLVKKNFVCS
jgi:hypothetical protein